MPRLLFLYFLQRIALVSLLIATGLCVPIVMSSLFQHLPPAAIRGGLLVPALLGTFPTVIYIVLPAAVGIAVALEFARMSADGMIAVLYSLRLGPFGIALPAAFVAVIAVAGGYWMSAIFAPAHTGQIHDVIYVIRNSLNHRLLEPAQFYNFDYSTRTIYFRRWISSDVVSGMFIYQISFEKQEEEVIFAEKAEFRRNPQGVVLIMTKGSIETNPFDGTSARIANFDEYAMPINMQGSGGLPKRSWRGPFELSLAEFFRNRPSPVNSPGPYAEWMSEGTKRFGVPALALGHALLAIGLVLNLGSATGRARAGALMAAIVVAPAVHVAILVGAETLVRKDPRLAWLVGAAIIAELAGAILLIARQNANFKLGARSKPI
jgi:lipopolysaccharide export system permease protein